MRSKVAKAIILAPFGIMAVLLFIAIGGAVVQWLWNWLLPPLFGWPAIGFWQALALLALCRILFGGASWGRGFRPKRRKRWRKRFAGMSDDERERFKGRMRERWGRGKDSSGTAEC